MALVAPFGLAACAANDHGDGDVPADGGPVGPDLDAFDAAFTPLGCAELANPGVLEAAPAFADPAVTCGRVSVPADWDVSDGETIDLAVYRLAASGDAPAPDPVVFLNYTTADNARDIDAVRGALDVPEWNLFDVSYGTALALTVLRDRPDGVRSVVLDSAVPPQASLLEELSYSLGYRPLERIVTRCGADADWAASAPVGSLTAERYLQILSADVAAPGIPAFVRTVAEGGDEEILALAETLGAAVSEASPPPLDQVDPALRTLVFDAGLMFAAVVCAEEVPFPRSDVSPDLSASFDETTRRVVEAYAAPLFDRATCDLLGVPPADALAAEPVESAVPAPVLAGDADVVTPPPWSETVAETLSRSQYLEFPGAGHVVTIEAGSSSPA